MKSELELEKVYKRRKNLTKPRPNTGFLARLPGITTIKETYPAVGNVKKTGITRWNLTLVSNQLEENGTTAR